MKIDPSKVIDDLLNEEAKKINLKRPRTRTVSSSKKLKIENSPGLTERDPATIIPQVDAEKFAKYQKMIAAPTFDGQTAQFRACQAKMNGHDLHLHYNSMYFLKTAIVDAIKRRKWNHLLQLVVMLGRDSTNIVDNRYIRHLCILLKHYHPDIRGTDVAEQLDLVLEKYTIESSRV